MKIRNKIITRSDAQKLAKVVSSLYKRKKAEGFEKILRFSVTCDDGSSFSSRLSESKLVNLKNEPKI